MKTLLVTIGIVFAGALICAAGQKSEGPSGASDAATIIVTTDSGGTGGPDCTLRDAITAANTDTPTGGCPAQDLVRSHGRTISAVAIEHATTILKTPAGAFGIAWHSMTQPASCFETRAPRLNILNILKTTTPGPAASAGAALVCLWRHRSSHAPGSRICRACCYGFPSPWRYRPGLHRRGAGTSVTARLVPPPWADS